MSQDNNRTWLKYCGFLDLSLEEFMKVQEQLLFDQLLLMRRSTLGRKIMNDRQPSSVAEFRSELPLTTYNDYQPYLQAKAESVLAEKPCFWAYTSGQSGLDKWVPYTSLANQRLLDTVMAGLILASADNKGEVNLGDRLSCLFNLPPRPYLPGHIVFGMAERFGLELMPPLARWEQMEFQQRIEEGFKMAVGTAVDVIGSQSSVLVKLGEGFARRSRKAHLSGYRLNPLTLWRLSQAALRSKLENRRPLPKDLWAPKCILSWGTDADVYRDDIIYYWGKVPHELHARTETGVIALQSWSKKGMTFVPYSVFFEFIAEEECSKSRLDKDYHPSTLLLNEVEPGKRYQLVITSFYGMPFLRYKMGDFVRILSLKDDQTGINLPQIVYDGRADEVIDIAGFTRLDEKTIWRAIMSSQIRCEDWTMRKEIEERKPVLHLYLELKDGQNPTQVSHLLHQHLKAIDRDYHDLEQMLEIRPLKVTLLGKGSFQRYYREKMAAGTEWTQCRPPRVNASDEVIDDLLSLSEDSL